MQCHADSRQQKNRYNRTRTGGEKPTTVCRVDGENDERRLDAVPDRRTERSLQPRLIVPVRANSPRAETHSAIESGAASTRRLALAWPV